MWESLIVIAVIAVALAVIAGKFPFGKSRSSETTEPEAVKDNAKLAKSSLPINRCQTARVTHVIDGDTFVVATSTQEIRIRLGHLI